MRHDTWRSLIVFNTHPDLPSGHGTRAIMATRASEKITKKKKKKERITFRISAKLQPSRLSSAQRDDHTFGITTSRHHGSIAHHSGRTVNDHLSASSSIQLCYCAELSLLCDQSAHFLFHGTTDKTFFLGGEQDRERPYLISTLTALFLSHHVLVIPSYC